MKSKILFLLVWSFFYQHMNAKNYYVSTNGKDTNNGSYEKPFKTFKKVVAVMSAGDVCIIRGGVYNEPLLIDKKGTSGNYLTFKAADGENVKIKATKFINGWQQHSGNIYKTSVNMTIDERFRNVYHNEKHMDLARWPNNKDNNRFTIDCKFIDSGSSNYFKLSDMPNFDWTGGLVYYLGGHSGASWTRRITKSTANRIEHTGVNINKWPFDPHNPTILRNGHRGQLYLFNKLEALDYGREWFYDNATKTLYFQTANGAKPKNNTVEYTTHKFVSELKGDYIRIEGIEFFGGSVKIRGSFNVFNKNKVIHGSEGFDNIANTGAGVGESAIEVLGSNTTISNCVINHSSANGISVQSWSGAHNAIIEKNTISNIDYLGIHATPIRTRANNVKVLKNKITNSGRDGMYVSGNNCEVAYNDVSKAQLINADSGVFYTVGNDQPKRTEIHHNWFHDSKPPSYAGNKAAGIYLDNNSKGYVVHHNVVWNVSWTGYQVNWNNVGLDFFHNTIWNADEAMGSWVNGYPQSNNKVYNNYANKEGWHIAPGFEYKNNIINKNSPFENANNLNFMPVSNGLVVDKGLIISGFEKKFKGAAPDIGAYEYGGTRWTAGINAIEDTGEGNVSKDEIQFSDRVTRLNSLQEQSFKVDYKASLDREIVVAFYKDDKWVASSKEKVSKGVGSKLITVKLPSILEAGKGYSYKSHIRPLNTTWREAIDNDSVNNVEVVKQFIADGIYTINSTQNNQRLLARALESHSARMHNSASFDDQKWIFKHISNNTYTIKNEGNKRYLEVSNGKCVNGANVATWTVATAAHQKWSVVENGNGVYGLKPLHCEGLGLDISAGAIDANVQIWNYDVNNNNQKWKIKEVVTINKKSTITNNFNSLVKHEEKVSFFPNPSQDVLFVSKLKTGDQISIYNLQGQELKRIKTNDVKEEISIENLSNGMYLIQINNNSIYKFIKK